MAKRMHSDRVKEIAKSGSPDDVVNLLRAYGNKTDTSGVYGVKYINAISLGVEADQDADRRVRKMSFIAAYSAKQGVFKKRFGIFSGKAAKPAETQETPAGLTPPEGQSTQDVVKGLRASIQSSAAAKGAQAPG